MMNSIAAIKFAKTKNDAKIPTKREEDMGLDVYACFYEPYIVINPHETVKIPTGIASACDPEWGFVLKERGSTGIEGMSIRAGIVDSGFRNEWQVIITNTKNNSIVISKLSKDETTKNMERNNIYHTNYYAHYDYNKAIAQALVLPVPELDVEEWTYEELKEIPSKRGMGMLGSSGK